MARCSCSILLLTFLYFSEICAKGIFTNFWTVKVRGGQREVKELAEKYGFSYDKHLFQDYHVFRRPELKNRSLKTRLSLEIDRKLEFEPQVEWFMHQKEKKYKLFSKSFNDPRFDEQWYIKRPAGSIESTYNILSAWKAGYTGKGVWVAVVDDGVDGSLPELSPNYNLTLSYDYVDGNDVNPSEKKGVGHGNRCAGIIAGAAGNGICGIGLAYKATVADITSTDAWESKALVHELNSIDIYSNSWGPGDMGWQVKGPGPLTTEALKHVIVKGRGGLGAIYTFSAGNGGLIGDSCAYNGYVNSIYTIAINGVNKDGSRPTYAEECPGIMATTFSRDSLARKGTVITVDSTTCVNDFGGTSAATAMASDLIALTLQANRNLTWRDLQHVIAHSARAAPGGVWLEHGHWLENKAGFYVSKFYGFGLMDAGRMVSLARNWTTVPPQLRCEMNGTDSNKSIPSTVSIRFSDCKIKFLEHVQIRLNLDFSRRGDLSLQLTAPSGTVSPLTRKRVIDNVTGYRNLTDWIITTLFHWGEDPTGKWELNIDDFDKSIPSKGTLYSWSLILYGTISDPRENLTRENVTRFQATLKTSLTAEPAKIITLRTQIRKTTPEPTKIITVGTQIPKIPKIPLVSWRKHLFIATVPLGIIMSMGIIVCCLLRWRRQRIRQAQAENGDQQTEQVYTEDDRKQEYFLIKGNVKGHQNNTHARDYRKPLSLTTSTWT